ncbi:MAG: hypothetical protein ACRCX2_24195 [Paraclostridium sp.]
MINKLNLTIYHLDGLVGQMGSNSYSSRMLRMNLIKKTVVGNRLFEVNVPLVVDMDSMSRTDHVFVNRIFDLINDDPTDSSYTNTSSVSAFERFAMTKRKTGNSFNSENEVLELDSEDLKKHLNIKLKKQISTLLVMLNFFINLDPFFLQRDKLKLLKEIQNHFMNEENEFANTMINCFKEQILNPSRKYDDEYNKIELINVSWEKEGGIYKVK